MDRLTDLIVAQTGCEPEQVHPAAAWAQLGMTAAEVAVLLGNVAATFKVSPTLADMATFATVGDLQTWLEENAK